MRIKTIYPICSSLFMLYGCTNANEYDLINQSELPQLVTYIDDVRPIIDNNCIICHSNPTTDGAPMPLISYENVKEAVQNRGLINRVSSHDLSFLMPLGGPRLPQNLINTIISWEEDGLLEN